MKDKKTGATSVGKLMNNSIRADRATRDNSTIAPGSRSLDFSG
jgi:hypothetical protein